MLTEELKQAVISGAREHAERFSTEHIDRLIQQSDCSHLLELLDDTKESAGIHPKVKIALRSIVKHVVYLEARLALLESPGSALR